MTQTEFNSLLDQKEMRVEKTRLDFDVIIDNKTARLPKIDFYDTSFSSGVWIEDIEMTGSVTFSYCRFEGGIHLTNLSNKTGGPLKITFTGCKLTGVSLSAIPVDSQISLIFVRSENTDPIGVSDSHLDLLRITQGTYLDIFMSDSSIKEFDCENLTCRSFELSAIVSKKISFIGITITQPNNIPFRLQFLETEKLHLTRIMCESDILIDKCMADDMQFHNCKGKARLMCNVVDDPRSLAAILMTRCGFDGGIGLAGTMSTGTKSKSDLGILEVRCDGNFRDRLTIENLDINTLNFSGFNSNCSIQVNSCRVHAFQFYDLINNNDLLLTNIQSLKKDFPSRFVITESRLGKAHWYNVNLHSFDRIVYRDSDIAEMSVSHVTWFSGKQYSNQLKITKGLSGEQKHELREQFKRQRDLFRQLKVVMDRQGDKAYSLEFFKWEMWNYKKVVKLRGTIWDRFVLLIGQTNDYGNNWIKPLAILGVLSFIIYIPIALLLRLNLITVFHCMQKISNTRCV